MPPSTSKRPSISIGESAAGIDMLARIARARLPAPSTTASPVTRSPATARNGTASWSKLSTCDARKVSREMIMSMTWPCTSPTGNSNSPSFKTRLLVDEKRVVVALTPERFELPRRHVQERRLPLEALDQLLELGDAHAGDVEAADDGADAGTRDPIDGHAQLLERLEHADVRAAACTAAG